MYAMGIQTVRTLRMKLSVQNVKIGLCAICQRPVLQKNSGVMGIETVRVVRMSSIASHFREMVREELFFFGYL